MPSFQFLVLAVLPILIDASPINRQVGISENVFMTTQNGTDGLEQRVCSIDAVTYMDGETIPTTSPCEHCVCRPPGFACTITSCEYRPGCKAFRRSDQCCPEYQCECEKDGKIYQNGEKIMDNNNPCEVCYCQGGEIICAVIDCYWRNDCPPRYIDNRCCPMYDHCPPPTAQGPIRHRLPSLTSPISLFNLTQLSSTTQVPSSSVEVISEASSAVISSTTTTTTSEPSSSTVVNPDENNLLADLAAQKPDDVVHHGDVAVKPVQEANDVASDISLISSQNLNDERPTNAPQNEEVVPDVQATPTLSQVPVISTSMIDSTTIIVPAALELIVQPTSVEKIQVIGHASSYYHEVSSEAPSVTTSEPVNEILDESGTSSPSQGEISHDDLSLSDSIEEQTTTQGSVLNEQPKTDQRFNMVVPPVENLQNDEQTNSSIQYEDASATTGSTKISNTETDNRDEPISRNDLYEASTQSSQADEIPSTQLPVSGSVQDVIYRDHVEETTPGLILNDEIHGDEVSFVQSLPEVSNLILDEVADTQRPSAVNDESSGLENDAVTQAAVNRVNDDVTDAVLISNDEESGISYSGATENIPIVHNDAASSVTESIHVNDENVVTNKVPINIIPNDSEETNRIFDDSVATEPTFASHDATERVHQLNDEPTEYLHVRQDDDNNNDDVATSARPPFPDKQNVEENIVKLIYDETTGTSQVLEDEIVTERVAQVVQDAPVTERINQIVNDEPASERISQIVQDEPATERISQIVQDEPATERISQIVQDEPATERISQFFQDEPATERIGQVVQDEPATERISQVVQDEPATERASKIVQDEPATERISQIVQDEPATERISQIVQDEPATERIGQVVQDEPATERIGQVVQDEPATERIGQVVQDEPATERASQIVQDEPATERASQIVQDEPATERASQIVQDEPATERIGQVVQDEPITEHLREVVYDEQVTERVGEIVRDASVQEHISQVIRDEAIAEEKHHLLHDEVVTEGGNYLLQDGVLADDDLVQDKAVTESKDLVRDEAVTESIKQYVRDESATERNNQPVRDEAITETSSQVLFDKATLQEGSNQIVQDETVTESNSYFDRDDSVTGSSDNVVHDAPEVTQNLQDEVTEKVLADNGHASPSHSLDEESIVVHDAAANVPENEVVDIIVNDDSIPSLPETLNLIREQNSFSDQANSVPNINQKEGNEEVGDTDSDTLEILNLPPGNSETTQRPEIQNYETIQNDVSANSGDSGSEVVTTRSTNLALNDGEIEQSTASIIQQKQLDKSQAQQALELNNDVYVQHNDEPTERFFRGDLELIQYQHELPGSEESITASKNTDEVNINDEPVPTNAYADEVVPTTVASNYKNKVQKVAEALAKNNEIRPIDSNELPRHKFRLDLDTFRTSYESQEVDKSDYGMEIQNENASPLNTQVKLEDDPVVGYQTTVRSIQESGIEILADKPAEVTPATAEFHDSINENIVTERNTLRSEDINIISDVAQVSEQLNQVVENTEGYVKTDDEPVKTTTAPLHDAELESNDVSNSNSFRMDSLHSLEETNDAVSDSRDQGLSPTQSIQVAEQVFDSSVTVETVQALDNVQTATSETLNEIDLDDSPSESPSKLRLDLELQTEATAVELNDETVTDSSPKFRLDLDLQTETSFATVHDEPGTESPSRLRLDLELQTESPAEINDEPAIDSSSSSFRLDLDLPTETPFSHVNDDEVTEPASRLRLDLESQTDPSSLQYDDKSVTEPASRLRLDLDVQTDLPSPQFDDESVTEPASRLRLDLDVQTEAPSSHVNDEGVTEPASRLRLDLESQTDSPSIQFDDTSVTESVSRLRLDLDVQTNSPSLQFDDESVTEPASRLRLDIDVQTDSPSLQFDDESVTEPASRLRLDLDEQTEVSASQLYDEIVTEPNSRLRLNLEQLTETEAPPAKLDDVTVTEPASRLRLDLDLQTNATPDPLNDVPVQSTSVPKMQNDYVEISTEGSVGFAQDDHNEALVEGQISNDEVATVPSIQAHDSLATSLSLQNDDVETVAPLNDEASNEPVTSRAPIHSEISVYDEPVTNRINDEAVTPESFSNVETNSDDLDETGVFKDAPVTASPLNDESATSGLARSGLEQLLLDDEVVNSTPFASSNVIFADEAVSTILPDERLRTDQLSLEDGRTESNLILHDSDTPTESQSQDEVSFTTTVSSAGSQNNQTSAPLTQGKAKKDEVILPETGLPKIQPISPELSRNNPHELRFDFPIPVEKDSSWLSRAVNQFRRLAGFSNGESSVKSNLPRANTRRFLFF